MSKPRIFKHSGQDGGDVDGVAVLNSYIHCPADDPVKLGTVLNSGAFKTGLIIEITPEQVMIEQQRKNQTKDGLVTLISPISNLFSQEEIADMNTYLIPEDYENIKENIVDVLTYRKGHIAKVEAKPVLEGLMKSSGLDNPIVPDIDTEVNPVITPDNFDELYEKTHVDPPVIDMNTEGGRQTGETVPPVEKDVEVKAKTETKTQEITAAKKKAAVKK